MTGPVVRRPLLYKIVRPDGRDLWTGTTDYRAAMQSGEIIRHPTSQKIYPAWHSTLLSAARRPTQCAYVGWWPWSLFAVEAVGEVREHPDLLCPGALAVLAMRVVAELPPTLALGPCGEQVVKLWDQFANLVQTPEHEDRLVKLWLLADQESQEANVALQNAGASLIQGLQMEGAVAGAYKTVRRLVQGKNPLVYFPLWHATVAALFQDCLTPDAYRALSRPWATFVDERLNGSKFDRQLEQLQRVAADFLARHGKMGL